MKIYYVLEEVRGTDNEFYAEVYHTKTAQEAGEMASSLVANMIEERSADDFDKRSIDPTRDWELDGGEWWYRVSIHETEI